MPVDMQRYPKNWKAISHAIKERAGWKCEQCAAPHHTWIARSSVDPARYLVLDADTGGYRTPDGIAIRMSEIPEEYLSDKQDTYVILTVHHIGVDKPDGTVGDPHDKMDCRPENLTALCQRCHLIADLPMHMENAKRTRLEKKRQEIADSGQMELFT